jgi:hypothetical protein
VTRRWATLALVLLVLFPSPGNSVRLSAANATAPPEQNRLDATAAPVSRNKIDDLVFDRLKRRGIPAAGLCSDAVFVRRVYLDVIGTLPTADETRAFLADPGPNKRAALVDRVLERDEFADYWAMKWADVLRVKSEFPINLWPNAVQAYHHWIRASIRDNVPYDRFVRELLTSSGSNFRVPAVNFYRAMQGREPQAIAAAVALTFMGTRAERWPKERLSNLALFFSQIGYKSTAEWKEEIVFFDPDKTAAGANPPGVATFPDGTTVRLLPGQDPREVFATWLVTPGNPWFARNIINRIWFWLLGRGIIHEPDDVRPDNPPAIPDLLALLERELVSSRYDLKHVYRLILDSATYQLSSVPTTTRADGEANFAYALLRPLDAEVLVDAVCQITGTSEQYSSPTPEPYTFVPPGVRSIALADGSITSTFLETFGRPPRDTGLASERNSRPTPAQRLFLLNSSDVQRKLQQGPNLIALMQTARDLPQMVNNLYLTILSRPATEDEMKAASAYVKTAGGNRRMAGIDIAWALINSAEFRYRH